MKRKKENIDDILEQLVVSTKSPKGSYSSAENYDKLNLEFPKQRTYSLFRRMAVAVAAAILLGVLGWSVYLYTQAANILTVSTLAETKSVLLPDGSEVMLNRYSSVSYSEKFKRNRKVTLKGEAYFEVAKDKSHPFIVSTDVIDVQVLGTHFNVEAYENDPLVKTTLLEGSVAVSAKGNAESVILKPNERAVYNRTEERLIWTVMENASDEIAWKNNQLLFNNLPLREIVQELSNAFSVMIRIDDPGLREYKMNARFASGEDLDEILRLLQVAGDFEYSHERTGIVITPNRH